MLCISRISVFGQNTSKDLSGQSKRYTDSPRLAITTILFKVKINIFTNYFYSSYENEIISTKQTFNASPTSQKFMTASLLSRWSNDGTGYHEFNGRKRQERDTRHTSICGNSFVKIAILV